MDIKITLESLRKVASKMKENKIPASTVKTRKEALELTANDPIGKAWSIGDKYYLLVLPLTECYCLSADILDNQVILVSNGPSLASGVVRC